MINTSAGTAAIYRYAKPFAYQDFPDHLLPQSLQNAHPLNILRLVYIEWITRKLLWLDSLYNKVAETLV